MTALFYGLAALAVLSISIAAKTQVLWRLGLFLFMEWAISNYLYYSTTETFIYTSFLFVDIYFSIKILGLSMKHRSLTAYACSLLFSLAAIINFIAAIQYFYVGELKFNYHLILNAVFIIKLFIVAGRSILATIRADSELNIRITEDESKHSSHNDKSVNKVLRWQRSMSVQ